MPFVIWFERIKSDMLPLVGGKGLHLGEMSQISIPVPPGFVVTTESFEKFLDDSGIRVEIKNLIEQTNVDDTRQLMETSAKIKQLIISKEMPQIVKNEILNYYNSLSFSDRVVDEKLVRLISAGREFALVAVRSSATAEDLPNASFAGQQATFLNVKGTKELTEAVKKAWASLYEPRAIFYRSKNNVKQVSIAIVVQRMVTSEKSGVMFTINPANGDDEIVIEAVWGLGETIVGGEVEPDTYMVSKDRKILSTKIGRKLKRRIRDYATDRTIEVNVPKNFIDAQVLSEGEISAIAEFGLILEKNYDQPQDVEFAIERNRIYIVQTRPVTTHVERKEVNVSGKELLRGIAVSPGIATGKVKIVRGTDDIVKIESGDILVTTMTSPDLVPSMSRSAAIVTDQGGITSHAAIVSREMGIPAVVGTREATQLLQDGQLVTVDAYNGIIFDGEVTVQQEKISEHVEESPVGPTATKVKVNLVFPEKLEEVAPKADGVGLLRIEHMIAKSGIHPAKLIRENRAEEYIKILLDGIRPIAQAFNPKPVWVRTLDARSDEFRNLQGGEDEPHEDNPMLGWHGIRRSLDEPGILKAEFEAMKRLHEEGLTNVHVMLPFVISVDEFRRARELAEEIGVPAGLKIGVMIETPAAALTIEEFCKEGIDFVSFGTNDLTQLTLGIDRNNTKISGIFSETHYGVLRQLKHVIDTTNNYDIENSICGEAGSNPEMVKILVGYGIKSVSCNIDAIDKIRAAVFQQEKEISNETIKQ